MQITGKVKKTVLNFLLLGLMLTLMTGVSWAVETDTNQQLARLERKLARINNGFEYHGYARSGYVMSGNGGAAPGGFSLGSLGKYRLGNEVKTYVEQTLAKRWTASDGAWMKANFMLVNENNGNSTWEADSQTALLRNAYVEGGNFDFSPQGVTFWAGQRYYGRSDIHITDFYWRDMSGYGAGVQGLKAGLGTLDVAFISQSKGEDTVKEDLGEVSQQNIDLRLKGITAPNGSLEFRVVPAWSKDNGEGNDKAERGFKVEAVYNRNDFYGIAPGFSKTAVQYGRGLGSVLGYARGTWKDEEAETMRTLTYGVGNLTTKTEIMPQFVYQVTDDGSDDNAETRKLSTGARLAHHHTENFAMQYEYGFQYQDKDSYEDPKTLNKFRVAPTITWKGSFWSRPQLRTFVTYAEGSDEVDLDGPKMQYEAGDSGVMCGVQMEVWW